MLPLAHEVLIEQGSDPWTKLAAVATLLAVLVALFGPLLLDRIRRPRLQVTVASDLIATLAGPPGNTSGRRLVVNVTNDGRRQANDVQVFVSAEAPLAEPETAGIHRIEAFQVPIPFLHQEGGQWTSQYSVAIPPGFSRPLELLFEEDRAFHLASPAAHDSGKPREDVFGLEDGDHRIIFDIVGSNFRVVRLEGVLRTSTWPSETESRWSKPPKVVRYRAGDPLPS